MEYQRTILTSIAILLKLWFNNEVECDVKCVDSQGFNSHENCGFLHPILERVWISSILHVCWSEKLKNSFISTISESAGERMPNPVSEQQYFSGVWMEECLFSVRRGGRGLLSIHAWVYTTMRYKTLGESIPVKRVIERWTIDRDYCYTLLTLILRSCAWNPSFIYCTMDSEIRTMSPFFSSVAFSSLAFYNYFHLDGSRAITLMQWVNATVR